MKSLLAVATLMIGFGPISGTAQSSTGVAGKWVVDQGKMREIDPTWDGVLTRDMWISTSGRIGGPLTVARSAGVNEVRDIRNTDTYDPTGKPTIIYVREMEASATARWEGMRLVAKIQVHDTKQTITRAFYRDGNWLVVEETGQQGARWSRTYFVKT